LVAIDPQPPIDRLNDATLPEEVAMHGTAGARLRATEAEN